MTKPATDEEIADMEEYSPTADQRALIARIRQEQERVHYAEGTAEANIQRANDIREETIKECAAIVENFVAGRTPTGNALKQRRFPSNTSVLISNAILALLEQEAPK